MKIVVVHGTNQLESRSRYSKICAALVARDWKEAPLTDKRGLTTILGTDTLFSEKIFVTCEGDKNLTEADFDFLKHFSGEGSLLVYFPKDAPATLKNKLPKTTVYEQFSIPKTIFSVIDMAYPGNGRVFMKSLSKVLESEPSEFVIGLLAKKLQELWYMQNKPELIKLPDWRISKIKKTSHLFGDKLDSAISSLAEVDIKIKEGGDARALLFHWGASVLN